MRVRELLEILEKVCPDLQVFAGYEDDSLNDPNGVVGAIYIKDLCETDDKNAKFTEGIYLRM